MRPPRSVSKSGHAPFAIRYLSPRPSVRQAGRPRDYKAACNQNKTSRDNEKARRKAGQFKSEAIYLAE